MNLNQLARQRVERLLQSSPAYRVAAVCDETGAHLVDCGVHVSGGLQAGIALAEVCLAGLGTVELTAADELGAPMVRVHTDQPIRACLGSQYAGWQITGPKYFAMGSGPMRILRGREPLLEQLELNEQSPVAVGVLEAERLPSPDVSAHIAQQCGVTAEQLLLLVAPTTSLAGSIQVVARTVETALHKLWELGFDLSRVVSGFGIAPLPPPANETIAAIGRTNDAVLYGARVTLWVRGDDEALLSVGPKVPSEASPDYGQPFASIFQRHGSDFYKIDPLLFSPAMVTFCNVETGRSFRFGRLRPDVLEQSFGVATS